MHRKGRGKLRHPLFMSKQHRDPNGLAYLLKHRNKVWYQTETEILMKAEHKSHNIVIITASYLHEYFAVKCLDSFSLLVH